MGVRIILMLSVVFFSACSNIEQVEVGPVQEFSLGEITSKDVSFEIAVPISNPNNFSFKITQVDLELSMNRKVLGKINKINTIKIPAKSNEVHRFKTRVAFDDIVSGSVSVLQSVMKNKANIKLDGFVKVRSFLISKKIDVNNESAAKLLQNR